MQANLQFPKNNTNDIVYIKELTFRSKSNKEIMETMKKIKDL